MVQIRVREREEEEEKKERVMIYICVVQGTLLCQPFVVLLSIFIHPVKITFILHDQQSNNNDDNTYLFSNNCLRNTKLLLNFAAFSFAGISPPLDKRFRKITSICLSFLPASLALLAGRVESPRSDGWARQDEDPKLACQLPCDQPLQRDEAEVAERRQNTEWRRRARR